MFVLGWFLCHKRKGISQFMLDILSMASQFVLFILFRMINRSNHLINISLISCRIWYLSLKAIKGLEEAVPDRIFAMQS